MSENLQPSCNQLATVAKDTNVPCKDLISRQAAIKAICEDGTWLESQGCTEITMAERKQRDADILSDLPSAQPEAKHPKWVAEDRYVKNRFAVFPHCPQCYAEVTTGQCYCMKCGQHIDWSEDDG